MAKSVSRASKDEQIIKDNPDASIHELRLAGVTEATLKKMESAKVAPVVKQDRAQPIIKTQVATFIPQDDQAVLVERATGKRTSMVRQYAEKLSRKNPKVYYVEN